MTEGSAEVHMQNQNMSGLDAIRARRARLEALTAQMRLPQLTPIHTHGRRPLTDYDIRSPLYPERKSAKYTRDRRRPSGAVKLEPLSDRPAEGNELDRRTRQDRLISSKSKASNKDDLLDLWKNQPSSPLPEINNRGSPLRDITTSSSNYKTETAREEEEKKEDHKDEEKQESELEEKDSDNKVINDKVLLDVIEMLKNSDEQVQTAGAQKARQQLANTTAPPIDQYIDAGILPLFISCIKKENITLQFECLWALTNIASGTTDQAAAICDAGCLPEVIKLLASGDDKVADQAVWTISNLAGDSNGLRDKVVEEGALPYLQKLIHRKPSSAENSLFFLKNLSWTFSNILRHKPLMLSDEQVAICVEAVTLFIQHSDTEIHTNALWSLAYVADGSNDQIQLVVNAGVLPRLVELLGSTDEKVTAAALRATGNVLTGDDVQTDEVISCGVVRPLIKLLDHRKSNIKKEAAWSMSNILAGTPEQIEIAISSGAFLRITALLMEGNESYQVNKECVWCLSNVTSAGRKDQVEKLVYYDGIQALAKMLDNHDYTVVLVALEGLSNILDTVETSKREISENVSEEVLTELMKSTSNSDVYKYAESLRKDLYDTED